jgi:hypothetical protein
MPNLEIDILLDIRNYNLEIYFFIYAAYPHRIHHHPRPARVRP